ncbi:MAG: hypothetical protein IJS54_01355 [Desulfovibrio sp.]|nr:hypothetical protein [Desulfovibrio sp.]
MAEEQERFLFVVEKMLDVVMFENWLRFYFITEMRDEDDAQADAHIFLIIPEKAMKKIEEVFPEFLPLATYLNNKEISFEISQQAICTYIVENIDGKIIEQDTAASIMDSTAFQVQLQLFNTWIQLHEDQLDQGFLTFDVWKDLFTEWKNSQPGKDLMEKLILSRQTVPTGPATVQ